MLKRKVVFSFAAVLILVLIVVAWINRNSNMLRDIDSSEVDIINFQDSTVSITISDQDDIKLVFEALQSMKFKSMLSYHNFGSALVFDIKMKNGQKYTMSVLSNDIIINGKDYKPAKDYKEQLKSIIDNLS